MVVLKVRRGQVNRFLLEVPDQSDQHCGVDIELAHACDEACSEAVEAMRGVVYAKRGQIVLVEPARDVLGMAVFGGP